MTPLESLEDLRNYLDFIKTERFNKTNLIRYFNERFNNIEKSLQALEIIDSKRVDTHWLKVCNSLDEYNDNRDEWEIELTQEEYDLLKEVLIYGN